MNENENIKVIENRVTHVEKRVDNLDGAIEKIWSKFDEYKNSQIVTQALVENLIKNFNDSRIDTAKVLDRLADKMDSLKTDIAKADVQRVQIESSQNEKRLIAENTINEKQGSKWENMYVKVATTVIGILLAIILVKLGLK